MIKIEKQVYINKNLPIPSDSLFFDIETTGFSAKNSRIYLVGTLSLEGDKYIFRQFLTESPEDEVELLLEFRKLIKNFKNLISFNGDTFDLRFIKQRAGILNLNMDLDENNSIDIYKIIKDRSFFMDFENLKLKTLERSIGIYREDTFSGGDLIKVYKDFEKGSKDLKTILLLHNEEDILNMPQLFLVLENISNENTIRFLGYSFEIEALKLTKNILSLEGKTNFQNAYLEFGHLKLTVKNQRFTYTSLVEFGDYDHINKCQFVEKDSYVLSCNYNIRTPIKIFLLKLGNKVLYKNIKDYFKVTLEDLLQKVH